MAVLHNRVTRDQVDYYPTPPHATQMFLAWLSGRYDLKRCTCWEPATGGGHMVDVLQEYFDSVRATDLYDPEGKGYECLDFIHDLTQDRADWIITNPPFNQAGEFALQAIRLSDAGCAMLVPLSFIEGQKRYSEIFRDMPPLWVLPYVKRLSMAKGKLDQKATSAFCMSWFVWVHGEDRDTKLQWLCDQSLGHFPKVARTIGRPNRINNLAGF